ncbi:metabolite transporter [Auriculariales sp. MPI-PUGE-AT-0066]|nr:metabolite transporter [Auriculariales sp. MPI-PUGE-AT-0066]
MSDIERQTRPKRGLSQVALIFACGTALFSDGYANGVIGSVNTMLRRLYPEEVANTNYGRTLSSLAFAGTVVGMLTFGYLSDRFGRKFGMMTATGIVALFSFLSATSYGAGGSIKGMLAALSAYRFLLGIGVGAEYPCGSVAASEQTEEEGVAKNAQHRWFVLATNTMIDFGFVIAALVPVILVKIFGENRLSIVWRGSLGLGIFPAIAVFIWRLQMEEPTRYKEGAMKQKVPYWLIFKRYWRGLVGISIVWFIYDFIVYPFGIYSSVIFDNLSGGRTELWIIFGWNVVSNLFYIPGTVVGAFFVDYLTPKYCLLTGLLLQALFGFVMSGCYNQLSKNIGGFAVMYGLFLSFGEFGPGNTLGLLASKTSPTAVRGQYYGIAAAIGKIGAFSGTWAFEAMIDAFAKKDTTLGNTGPFWVGSGLAIFSAIVAFFMITPLTHDGMVEEDRKFREYLEQHGYDLSNLGLTDDAASSKSDLDEKRKDDASITGNTT